MNTDDKADVIGVGIELWLVLVRRLRDKGVLSEGDLNDILDALETTRESALVNPDTLTQGVLLAGVVERLQKCLPKNH
ncbi:MAG: hypothetical protein OXF11_11970 [Deltaproteobacteria bacterium]|nr:hypothetical protein [Deltaproteobacteria bacterium]